MTSNRHESESDLNRSSWEGMGGPEISHEVAKFIFAVQSKFLDDQNILDLESAAISIVSEMNDIDKDALIESFREIIEVGLRACLEKLIPNDELIKIDKEETKRLIDFIQYSGSTPG